VSVGADSARHRACYSNFGSWVTAWEIGTMVLSIMPITTEPEAHGEGYARWSGTSFSAATHAGRLAQEVIDEAANAAVVSRPGA